MKEFTNNEHRINLKDLGDDEAYFFKNVAQPFWEEESKEIIDSFNSSRSNRFSYEGILPAEYTHQYNKICKDIQRRIVKIRKNLLKVKQ